MSTKDFDNRLRRAKAKAAKDFENRLRRAKAKAAKGQTRRPKPHPDLDHQLLGIAVNIEEQRALIQREWEAAFAQEFPGWSPAALASVAAFTGLPKSVVSEKGRFQIYAAALAKKRKASRRKQDCIFLGDGRYQVGDEIIALDGAQAAVLDSLVILGAATLDQLKNANTVNQPAAILKAICKSNPALATFIVMPGRKSRGGYRANIAKGQ